MFDTKNSCTMRCTKKDSKKVIVWIMVLWKTFFGSLKVEMFYGKKFESVNAFIDELKRYIDYYNNERISLKLKGMSPVQYRTHSLVS